MASATTQNKILLETGTNELEVITFFLRTFDKAKVRCYNCQGYGHYSWENKCNEMKKKAEAHLIMADADYEPALL